ncbi:cocaine- and amphetamine-regulated transcript-like [Acanthochromis polyacanthus]|uniref:cocaine- and amphetamine-regulated transcript-like n=1 Tax=Acanthochromis polyacanthus TaxID=80966 RepID=UPI0022345D78|nr:cocaine- and amphetamine-regulated transcript-like [Acanthochromis polyacanthus]
MQGEAPAATLAAPALICCLLPGPPPSCTATSTFLHRTSALLHRTSTMESSGSLLGLLLLLGLLSVLCHGQVSLEVSDEFGEDKPEAAADRDLLEALEALLGRAQNRVPSTEKRGSIPLCGMGDRCAMKFGPRIGKLCDCGRAANCNSYLLKCI